MFPIRIQRESLGANNLITKMEMSSERQKKYDVFIKLCRKAYSLLEKKKQYLAGQDL